MYIMYISHVCRVHEDRISACFIRSGHDRSTEGAKLVARANASSIIHQARYNHQDYANRRRI